MADGASLDKMSILVLNNDCLIKIMSNIDEYASFYNFSLVCKRFYNVVTRVVRDWHYNIKARKVMFYAMNFMTVEYHNATDSRADKDAEHWPGLDELSRHIDLYQATKPTLDNVERVWRSRGPVAAELFTWINNVRIIEKTDLMQKREERPIRKREITLLLPKTQKELTYGFRESRPEWIIISAKFGEEDSFVFKCSYQRRPGYYYDWSDRDIDLVFNHVYSGRILDVIRENLGETNHPVTGRNLLWLLFYPESLETEPRSDDLELVFQDISRNMAPTLASVEPALQRLEQSHSMLIAIGESQNVMKIVEMLKYMENYPKSLLIKLLQNLHKVAKRFRYIPQELLMCLMLRTTASPPRLNEVSEPVTEERCFTFRINRGQILQGKLLLEADNDSTDDAYMRWEFELPDGSTINFDRSEIKYIDYGIIDCEFEITRLYIGRDEYFECDHEVTQQVLDKINPVVQFLRASIEDERIDHLNNKVFLRYFWEISTHFCVNKHS